VAEPGRHAIAEFLGAQARHADHAPDVELQHDVHQHRHQDGERERRPSCAVNCVVWVMKPGPMALVAIRNMAPSTGPRAERGCRLCVHRVSAPGARSLGEVTRPVQPQA